MTIIATARCHSLPTCNRSPKSCNSLPALSLPPGQCLKRGTAVVPCTVLSLVYSQARQPIRMILLGSQLESHCRPLHTIIPAAACSSYSLSTWQVESVITLALPALALAPAHYPRTRRHHSSGRRPRSSCRNLGGGGVEGREGFRAERGDARKSWAQRKPADIKVMRGEAYETTDRFERDSPTWEKQQDSFKRITHWELAIQRITQ